LHHYTRKVWIYQRGNQKSQIEGQSIQWPKVSFIHGGNRVPGEKPLTCRNVTDKLEHVMLYRLHLTWAGFELTTSVVIGTDCTGSCKFNYHMITNVCLSKCDLPENMGTYLNSSVSVGFVLEILMHSRIFKCFTAKSIFYQHLNMVVLYSMQILSSFLGNIDISRNIVI
jgi:hypothetical protein